MTPDERTLLQRFLQDLTQTPAGTKDAEANDLIAFTLRDHPDAAYVLVQHAILSDQALLAAQGQIVDLTRQLNAQPQPGGASFLGSGQAQQARPSPWAGQSSQPGYPPQYPQGQYPQGQYPQGQYAQPDYGAPGYVGPGPFSSGGGLGSFLRSAGTTAAGVAGGAFLFEGLSSLFGGHQGGGGGFGGWGGGGGAGFGGGNENIVENVTNNYYDDDDDRSDDDDGDDNDDS